MWISCYCFEFNSFMDCFLSLRYFLQIWQYILTTIPPKPLLDNGFSVLNYDLPFQYKKKELRVGLQLLQP